MKIRTHTLCVMIILTITVSLPFWAGCGVNQTQGLFTKPSLTNCHRMAVLGLDEEQEQILMASYLQAFPEQGITFVERGQLQKIISEQDLLQGRLNDRTRAKMREILGVEALILGVYYDAAPKSPIKKLRLRVVDSATGAITGSVITQSSNTFVHHCYTATQALKTNLKNGHGIGKQTDAQYSFNRW